MPNRVGTLALLLAAASTALAQEPRAVGTGVGPQGDLPGPCYRRKSEIDIPFKPNSLAEPTLVQVFVSVDAGRSWRKYTEVLSSDKGFTFRPPRDGEYWLATQAGSNAPPDGRHTAQVRLIVDSLKPIIQITPELAANGEVLVSFRATDEYLDPQSLVLEYQVGNMPEWAPLEIDSRDVAAIAGGLQGTARLKPPLGTRLVKIRGVVKDRAGNVVSSERTVGTMSVAGPTAGPAATLKTMVPVSPEPLASAQRRPDFSPRKPPEQNEPSSTAARTDSPDIPARESTGSGAFGTPPSAEPKGPGRLAGYPRDNPEVPSTVPSAAKSPLPPQEIDPYADRPRLINKKRFNLDYDVESVGVAGIAEVELWGTSDRGQTWARWGVDPDLKSPMEVEVSNESTYGFRIVIVGRNGLTSARPKLGDPADVWVLIDATPPECRLTSVTYGQGDDAGKLDIRWEAADAQVSERGVTLLMSDKPDGAWAVIAAGLPNSGQYLWPYDPRAPQQIYLRLEVRDEAGNSGVFQTSEPIRVEGLTPKGRIRNVAPLETGRSPFRTPLFR